MKKLIVILIVLVSVILLSMKNVNSDTRSLSIETTSYNGIELTVLTIKKNSMDFSVVTKNPTKNDFYMNSNFFTPSVHPIGEVICNGKKINGRINSGGFFYTKNGQPMISMGSRPKGVKNCSQTNYIGIINGKVNKGTTNRGVNKQKAYRTLIGKNSNGDLVVIVSGRFGMISMGDISKFGITKGIKFGLIFDGGSSVDVGVSGNGGSYSFKSVPGIGKSLAGIPEPPVYIVGNFK